MSSNAGSKTRSFPHAIFSSTPINFNKENAPPPTKHKTRYFDDPESDVVAETKISSNSRFKSNLIRSKSVTMLQKEEPQLTAKSSSEERLKTPSRLGSNSRLCGDKTPITHFCTPRRVSGSKTNITLATSKTPIKRYFSDHNPPAATPECYSMVQMETPRGRQDLCADEQTICEGEQSNLTVGVRVRPLSFKELNDQRITAIVRATGQTITVECDSSRHTFTYDHCFVSFADSTEPDHASQEIVFNNMVLPLVDNAFDGYNACLFAYGQTGSGKSYSMMGTETCYSTLGAEAGIIPRFCDEIFSRASNNPDTATTVEISYFEIYNEKIHDLLGVNTGGGKRAPLKVREHPVFGPYVVDLSQHGVNSYEDLQGWLKVGNSQRATAATGMNEKSSRSHSIFSVILTQTQRDSQSGTSGEPSRRSKINLVDLAGSERLSQTCASGDRLREGVSINKSLLTLGKVIASLAESTNNRKRGFVPYRESVLTWLLRESLGGNSRTAMLGTVSPANIHMEETLATLRYACQARAIINRVRVNEDSHERLIRELKAEVARLRGIREGYERHLGGFPRRIIVDPKSGALETASEIKTKEREIETLREQLKKTEEQLVLSQKSWSEKLRDAEEKKNTELTHLKRCGIALGIDFRNKSAQPCLVNLAADPILSGTLLYLLPNGLVRVGRQRDGDRKSSRLPDIVLDGPLVREQHCTIENDNGKLTLSTEMQGDTYVNGQVVTGKVFLKHGDRLVIGGNHYFRVCNPLDEQGGGKISAHPVDFEFAHQEILKIQQEKLRAELEESKQKVIKELENAKKEVEMQLGSQKSTYEEQLQVLGSSLEQQKLALAEVHRKKHELELEKELLASEVETNNRIRRIQFEEDKVTVSPYRSNFLQDLEDILNETTADAEIALSMDINDEENSRGVSLREMQLMVKEASTRCREAGINYITEHLNESMHQISMDASMMETAVESEAEETRRRHDDMRKWLRQMEEAAKNLGNIFNQQDFGDVNEEVTISLDKVKDVIVSIKETLGTSHNNESNGSSNTSENNTVIENCEGKYLAEETTASPSKSNLRSCPFLRNGLVPKSTVADTRMKFEAMTKGETWNIEARLFAKNHMK